jgi:hypothetical protein
MSLADKQIIGFDENMRAPLYISPQGRLKIRDSNKREIYFRKHASSYEVD